MRAFPRAAAAQRQVATIALGLLLGALGATIAPVRGQSRATSDSLRQLVARNDVRVSVIVRQDPDSARALFARLFAEVAKGSSEPEATPLTIARRLAAVYADVWRDSFFVRQVARFASWSRAQQQTKAAVDSLRVAGGAALSASGPAAALRLWRESYRLAGTIGDSAGQASALGNIAVAFYRDRALDSAEAYLNRTRTLAERIGDQRTRVNALGTLATVAMDRGDAMRAKVLYTQTLALRLRIGDDRGAASDENNLGLVAEAMGDTASARRFYDAALARNRAGGRTSVASNNIVNLANLAVLQGDYGTAARQYRDALAIRHAAGERAREASVLHNIGLLALRRGDYAGARDALQSAVNIYDETGPVDAAIEARAAAAQAFGAMGELQGALATLRDAESLAARDSLPRMLAIVALARADLAVEFNAFADAEREYSAAASMFERVGDRRAAADAQQGLGMVRLRRDDPAGARAAFDAVLGVRTAARDRQASALTQILLGATAMETGDTATARRFLVDAQQSLAGLGDITGEASALGALAELELRAGNAARGQSMFDRALARAGLRATPGLVAYLRSGRALARAARGDLDAAAVDLRAAIDATERVAGQIPMAEGRTAYRADKWIMYERLAIIETRRGRPTAAFEISERMRGREMLELLASGRVAGGAGADSVMRSREQDLRRRIALIEDALEREHTRGRVRGVAFRADAATASRAALASAQEEYTALLARLREESSGYASLLRPTIMDASAVSARLKPDEVLLEYLVADSTTLVFVVRRDGVQVLDLSVPRRTLAAAVDFTRETIGALGTTASKEPWRPPLERLYRLLIDPIDRTGALRGVRTILIAPHGELHYLPFAALLSASAPSRFLVERFDIAYVPSASLWVQLGDRRGASGGTGVVAFAPRPDALPASRDEVRSIQTAFGRNTTVLTGSAATEAAFRRLAPAASVVHFATFGVLNRHNPLFSFVELAGDGADEGRLFVHEVFGTSLKARLVVLSACQTALASGATADVPAGDDWIGLVRAFLHAGADNVLATLWPVLDRSSAVVMRGFYQELRARPAVTALAIAQRAAIRDKQTAAPIHWAAYALSGAIR